MYVIIATATGTASASHNNQWYTSVGFMHNCTTVCHYGVMGLGSFTDGYFNIDVTEMTDMRNIDD